jgi:hypothetical protein
VFGRVIVGLVVALAASGLWADDLTGASRFLCASVQATKCVEGGACGIDLPWNLNIPEFIEVDLTAKKLSTTAASGENRATPIAHLARENGLIVLQGFEMGRAFSFVITETTGHVAVAVATEGRAVAVFGACTPLPVVAEPGRK